jgi:hypothetical protein
MTADPEETLSTDSHLRPRDNRFFSLEKGAEVLAIPQAHTETSQDQTPKDSEKGLESLRLLFQN